MTALGTKKLTIIFKKPDDMRVDLRTLKIPYKFIGEIDGQNYISFRYI